MTDPSDMDGDDWAGILDPDEKVIWQGRPDGRFVLERRMLRPGLYGVGFAAFATIWLGLAVLAGAGIEFWGLGLLFIAVGLWITVHALFQPTFLRRRTWYTLTNRRAFVATDLPVFGRSLTSYPINRGVRIDRSDPDRPSVIFAAKKINSDDGARVEPIGFERIVEAQHVFQLMQGIEK